MSNETLSYLGYEDLSDFSSQHSDFANLLVNKEGYIYKFQNFSWIDFILYSGSPNKSALLQLKSGEPLEIKLSVKEVHLLNELGGSSKFYAVRILSDNFVNIAAKTDASITKQSPPKNAFNLNNLMDDTTSSTPAQERVPEIETQEVEAKSDFVLNFPSSESLTADEETAKLDFTDEKEDDFVLPAKELTTSASDNAFKLNLSDTFLKPEDEKEIVEEASNEEHSKKEDFALNFLKEPSAPEVESHHDDSTQEEVKLDFIKPVEDCEAPKQEEDMASGFKLKHIEMDEAHEPEEDEEEKITLNFLKAEPFSDAQEKPSVDEINITPSQEELQTPKVEANLNFLNQSNETVEKPTESQASKEQIIAQIQNDIKEIDEVEEEKTFVLQEPQETAMPHEDVDAYLFNKNEVKKEKKSFTKTLQSLFAESNNMVAGENENNDDTYIEAFSAPAATLKNETSSAQRFPTLAALGLEKEEEDDLISEFVTDTKANIRLFKDFYHSKNIDQAEYTLIKMQSSANILNLNDIIITLANVKQSCTNNDSESIEQLTATLEKQVSTLESYLESETV